MPGTELRTEGMTATMTTPIASLVRFAVRAASVLFVAVLPVHAAEPGAPADLAGHWAGILSLVVFAVAYALSDVTSSRPRTTRSTAS